MTEYKDGNWQELVGGYPIEDENREELLATSVEPQMLMQGDLPEMVDPRNHPQAGEGFLQVENQGSIGSCFPAGVMVTMHDGSQKPIENVRKGDVVISHTRKPRQVVGTMSREYTGLIVEVFVKGWDRIRMTADHVVPVKRNGNLEWVRADQIEESDLILVSSGREESPVRYVDVTNFTSGIQINEDAGRVSCVGARHSMPRKLELDELTCWCIGLFVAEGSTDSSPSGVPFRATWTLHENETGYVDKLCEWADRLGVPVEVAPRTGSKAINVRMSCGVLASFLRSVCGRFCNKKKVPAFILCGSEVQKRAFLLGYYDGDGSSEKCRKPMRTASGGTAVCNQIHAASASRVLSLQISQLLVSLGMKPGRTVTQARSHQRYASHQVYLYSSDAASFYDMPEVSRKVRRQLDQCEFGQWRKIREINRTEVVRLPVFDFTVEKDHSFVADGVAVHNCQGQSLTECAEFCYMLATGLVIQFSRMFAYIASQMADGIRTDSGSTLNGGTKASTDVGFCPESDAPYPSRYPGWGWLTQKMRDLASKFKLRSHSVLRTVEDTKAFIGSGLGIVQIGISWNGSMEPDANGCIRDWSPNGGGGHAVCFVGYLPDSVVGQRSTAGYWFLLKNSWGTRWGKKGYAYVDPAAVREMLGHRWTVFVGRSDMSTPRPRPIRVDFTKPGASRFA